jgi:hypothetical protein
VKTRDAPNAPSLTQRVGEPTPRATKHAPSFRLVDQEKIEATMAAKTSLFCPISKKQKWLRSYYYYRKKKLSLDFISFFLKLDVTHFVTPL